MSLHLRPDERPHPDDEREGEPQAARGSKLQPLLGVERPAQQGGELVVQVDPRLHVAEPFLGHRKQGQQRRDDEREDEERDDRARGVADQCPADEPHRERQKAREPCVVHVQMPGHADDHGRDGRCDGRLPCPRKARDTEANDGLEYPVGLDNDFVAWNAYGNRYWPTMYLIDRAGQIRYTQIGEGNYGRTENAIRTLLSEALGPAAETRAAS